MFLVLLCTINAVLTKQVDIEDINARQLETAIETEQNLAIFWYSKNCKTCDRVLNFLERIADEVQNTGTTLLKINDKKSAKTFGIRNFPSISVFRDQKNTIYEGEILNQESVTDFLTSENKAVKDTEIEQVSVQELDTLVSQNKFVAVFFFSEDKTTKFKRTSKVIKTAGELDIRVVAINDLALVAEYNLEVLPALVYYRHKIPILFEGDMSKENDVLEWLVQNRHTGEDEDGIEELAPDSLKTVINNVDMIAVLFCKENCKDCDKLMKILKKINSDCSKRGVHFVSTTITPEVQNMYSVVSTSIFFYKNKVSSKYKGSLSSESELSAWMSGQTDPPEEDLDQNLGSVIQENMHIVIVFCRYIAYVIIALTHTCYLIKNYNSFEFNKYLTTYKNTNINSEC